MVVESGEESFGGEDGIGDVERGMEFVENETPDVDGEHLGRRWKWNQIFEGLSNVVRAASLPASSV